MGGGTDHQRGKGATGPIYIYFKLSEKFCEIKEILVHMGHLPAPLPGSATEKWSKYDDWHDI